MTMLCFSCVEPSTKWMLNKYLDKGGNSCPTSCLNIYFLNKYSITLPNCLSKPSNLEEKLTFR